MTKTEPSIITPADLCVLGADFVEQLHQAAIRVDGKQILQLILQIPDSHTGIASSLSYLVDNFCFEEIITLTQPNLANHHD